MGSGLGLASGLVPRTCETQPGDGGGGVKYSTEEGPNIFGTAFFDGRLFCEHFCRKIFIPKKYRCASRALFGMQMFSKSLVGCSNKTSLVGGGMDRKSTSASRMSGAKTVPLCPEK